MKRCVGSNRKQKAETKLIHNQIKETEEYKEAKQEYQSKICFCPVCKYEVKLYKKEQHEKSMTHQSNLNQMKKPLRRQGTTPCEHIINKAIIIIITSIIIIIIIHRRHRHQQIIIVIAISKSSPS